jgi:hypothetical protein
LILSRLDLDAVPDDLKARPQWVAHQLVETGRKRPDGTAKLAKIPRVSHGRGLLRPVMSRGEAADALVIAFGHRAWGLAQ